jgi:hypothetical protein
MALTTRLTAAIEAVLTNPQDLGTAEFPLSFRERTDLATGTGSGLADRLFTDTRTIAASGTEDLDLAGSLTGPLGTTVTFAKIKAVLIHASAGNTNSVRVTRPASNGVPLFLAASDGLDIPPDGVFMWSAPVAGVAVTAGTGDLITIANSSSGTSVTYDVIIVGTSA